MASSGSFDVEGWLDAWERLDEGRLLPYYAEDVEYVEPALESPLRGREEYRRNAGSWMASFRDVRIRAKDVLRDGDLVVVHAEASALNSGELEVAGGLRLPPTGRRVRVDVAVLLEIDGDGRIRRERQFYDTSALIRQLGINPAALASGARGSP